MYKSFYFNRYYDINLWFIHKRLQEVINKTSEAQEFTFHDLTQYMSSNSSDISDENTVNRVLTSSVIYCLYYVTKFDYLYVSLTGRRSSLPLPREQITR